MTDNFNNNSAIWARKPVQIVSLLALFCINSVNAQQREGFISSVDTSLNYQDNVFRVEDEQADSSFNLAPKIQFTELFSRYRLLADYQGNYVVYNDLSNLNYTDHDASVTLQGEHSSRFSSELFAQYQDAVELPGETNALTSQLDEFNQTSTTRLQAQVAYGTVKSAGQIIASYRLAQNRFDNNQQSFRDYDENRASGQFLYRIAAKTRLLFEASRANLDYDNVEIVDLSSTQNQYMIGVEWNATAKSSSVFKLGYQDVNYDDDTVSDIDGLSYYLDLYWVPSSYALLNLAASRSTRESAEVNVGGFISERYAANLQYELGARTKADFRISYIEDDFSNSQQRRDKKYQAEIKLGYSAKRWLDVYLGVSTTERRSSVDIYDFNATQLQLGLVASFD